MQSSQADFVLKILSLKSCHALSVTFFGIQYGLRMTNYGSLVEVVNLKIENLFLDFLLLIVNG